jgi:hypothetical protein
MGPPSLIPAAVAAKKRNKAKAMKVNRLRSGSVGSEPGHMPRLFQDPSALSHVPADKLGWDSPVWEDLEWTDLQQHSAEWSSSGDEGWEELRSNSHWEEAKSRSSSREDVKPMPVVDECDISQFLDLEDKHFVVSDSPEVEASLSVLNAVMAQL